jgi:regulator of protease activity HflC (stomatin/prohibitin superfamily)
MFGIRYMKVAPTTHVLQVVNGKTVREGTGLAFFYFAPRTTLIMVPVGSTDVPFVFQETTADFQTLTAQGALTFRVSDPQRLAAVLDFSMNGASYASEDPSKLLLRVTHAAQTATRAQLQARALRACLIEADAIGTQVRAELGRAPALQALGVEILDFSILALKPPPETGRALEAQARERLLREADDAVYERRNSAVEQERRIRENELATEVAVQTKQRQIEETKLAASIALESQRRELVTAESENTRALADAREYASSAALRPLRELDPKTLQVLALASAEPRSLVALAFQELAANAAKIGNLNISPELLDTLLRPRPAAK